MTPHTAALQALSDDLGQTHFVGDDCQPPHTQPAALLAQADTSRAFADWLAEHIDRIEHHGLDEAEINAVRHGIVITVKVARIAGDGLELIRE